METTKPEWRKSQSADSLRRYIDTFFKVKNPSLGNIDREVVIDWVANEISSHLTGTVKVEELRRKIEALETDTHIIGGSIFKKKVLELINEKK